MIQHLVTSNPSPAYVNRVAQVFKNDGTGVRGNLQAVITAILLDPEARDSATDIANPQFGKVREALLRYTEWARAFTAQSRTGSFDLGSTEDPIYGLGEMWLRSPTVFNWFSPGYTPPGTTHCDGWTAGAGNADDQCFHGGGVHQLSAERDWRKCDWGARRLFVLRDGDESGGDARSVAGPHQPAADGGPDEQHALQPDSYRSRFNPDTHRRSERDQCRAS